MFTSHYLCKYKSNLNYFRIKSSLSPLLMSSVSNPVSSTIVFDDIFYLTCGIALADCGRSYEISKLIQSKSLHSLFQDRVKDRKAVQGLPQLCCSTVTN